MDQQNQRQKALQLIDQYIKNENLKKHLLASENLMRHLARKLNHEKDEETWALAGLLHDLDWEITKETPAKHTFIAAEVLKKEGFSDEIIEAIKKHHPGHNFVHNTLLEKALYCCEELTGFITAVALVTPSKKLNDVSVERLLKKFKEPSFARGVNREVILQSEIMLGFKLEQIMSIALQAMQEISNQLNL